MRNVSEPLPNNKAELARRIHAAQMAADAYNGPTEVDYFRGHSHFDLVDGIRVGSPNEPVTGLLTHDTPNCPYCKLRNLRRAYGLLSVLKGPGHGKDH
jgi:hypothetical protein